MILPISKLNQLFCCVRLFGHVPFKRDQLEWDWRMRSNDTPKTIGCVSFAAASFWSIPQKSPLPKQKRPTKHQKRPIRVRWVNAIEWHSKCNRLYPCVLAMPRAAQWTICPCTLNHASIPLHLNHTLPLRLSHASRSTYTRISLHNNIPTWICISFDMDTPLFWHGYTAVLTWIYLSFDMDVPLFWHGYTKTYPQKKHLYTYTVTQQ